MYLTWAEVDLAAIQNNVRRMRALTGTRVMAVVKANAYGHGAVEVSRAAQSAGADWLGVARADEGLALRAAGLALPILVLGYTPPAIAAQAIAHDLALTVFEFEAAQAYAAVARALNRTARVHLKVDTGMGRLGVLPAAVPEFFKSITALSNLEVEGLFTHFANADATPITHHQSPIPNLLSPASQLSTFESLLPSLPFRPALLHAANSAAALAWPAARLDMVRVGIALHGLHPSAEVPCPADFVPALTWKARVMQVKTLPPGHGISYGHQYVTTETETVAVVGVGYADGFRRRLNANEVLLSGRRAPVRGRVCMDQIIVGASHLPEVRVGDEVVLIGRQAGEALTAEDLARRWETINYEVTSGLAARVPRLYR